MNHAELEAEFLRNCGLVYHERQSDGTCWIGPPSTHLRGIGRVKVKPLMDVEPQPFMEVRAHGEKYEIPYDFQGNWFAVRSPSGRLLIAQ